MALIEVRRKEAERILGYPIAEEKQGTLVYPGDLTHDEFKEIDERRLYKVVQPEHSPHGLYFLQEWLDGLYQRDPKYREKIEKKLLQIEGKIPTAAGVARYHARMVNSGEFELGVALSKKMDRHQFVKWLHATHQSGLKKAEAEWLAEEALKAVGEKLPGRAHLNTLKQFKYELMSAKKHPNWAWLLK